LKAVRAALWAAGVGDARCMPVREYRLVVDGELKSELDATFTKA
jgi:hypothetical protein